MSWLLHPIRTWREAREERRKFERANNRLLYWAINNRWPDDDKEVPRPSDRQLRQGLIDIVQRVKDSE